MPPVKELRDALKLFSDHHADLLHLFVTNEAPTESEQLAIRAMIPRTQSYVEDTTPLVNPTTSALTRRRRRRNAVKRIIDSIPSILHPIRRVPREIIAEIVLHALDHYGDDRPMPATLNTAEGPWVYSQVSQFWRDVVVSFPKLWSVWEFDTDSLSHLDEDDPEDKHIFKHSEDNMRTIVCRSKDASLDVFVNDTEEMELATIIVDIIFCESHRWKRAKIWCGSISSLVGLNVVVEDRLDRLEHLDLRIYLDIDPVDEVDGEFTEIGLLLYAFEVAPRLNSVALDVGGSGCEIDVLLPWTQLTHFREPLEDHHCIYPDEHMKTISQLCNVIECELSPSFGDLVDFDPSPIILPRMRKLLAGDSNILEYITVPALETLDLGIDSGFHPEIHSFLQRSQCALQELIFGNAFGPNLVDVLRLVPTLRCLVLRWTPFIEQMIEFLSVLGNKDEVSFLPVLSRLSIHAGVWCNPELRRKEETLIETVESRVLTDRQTRLTYVCCDLDFGEGKPRFSAGFDERVKKLRQGGLEIVLRNSPRPKYLSDL